MLAVSAFAVMTVDWPVLMVWLKVDFMTSGAEVNGGGSGPFVSPLTLRFNAGSRGTPLPFLPRPLASASLRASCSSKVCSYAGSTDHSAPLPFSSGPRSTFLNERLDDRLCRTELCARISAYNYHLQIIDIMRTSQSLSEYL